MDNPPFISIIVLNWNGEGYVAKCLDSLLDQTYPNYEVIVVDNSSTDGSVELLKGYLPRINLMLNQENVGFAAGNNVAIREAKGEFIVLFNNDAVAHREWLERLITGVLYPPQADIASGPIYFYEPSDVIWSGGMRSDMLSGEAWNLGSYQQHFKASDDIDYFAGCALLIAKRVFDEIGFLDERFFFYSEDCDFCFRAKRAGFSLRLVPDAIVWHMIPMSLKQPSVRLRHDYYLESRIKLVLKLWPFWCIPITLILQIAIIPIAYVLLLRYPLVYPIMVWRALFSVIAEGCRNGFQRDYSRGLPLHIRTLECLRVAGQRLRKGSSPITSEMEETS